FERALTSRQLRGELERKLNKSLSDDILQSLAAQARAEADYWSRYRLGLDEQFGAELSPETGRLAPGRPPPEGPEPIVNPGALPPPRPFESGGYLPVPDRWRILDALGRKEDPFDPYNTNTLKGDKPIFGEDWFLN